MGSFNALSGGPTVRLTEYDIDKITGFMAPYPPPARLPPLYEPWEAALDSAIAMKLQVGDKEILSGVTLSEADIRKGTAWREDVMKSMAPSSKRLIPRSIGIPLLQVSKELDLPPILTYSDIVLYNWDFIDNENNKLPTVKNIRSQTMFTNTKDEEEFYLVSGRIEIRGVEALWLMQETIDLLSLYDDAAQNAQARAVITANLERLASTIKDLQRILMDFTKTCNPDVFYNQIRPWLRGEDLSLPNGKWVWEGLKEHPELEEPTELAGPNAGQSPLVHVLDIFLGVDHSKKGGEPTFMDRIKAYIPAKHRTFLNYLSASYASSVSLRTVVTSSSVSELLKAYNLAVLSLKEFRDSHMIIITLFILGPARRAQKLAFEKNGQAENALVKGTGGMDLVKFLKDTRARTKDTLIPGSDESY